MNWLVEQVGALAGNVFGTAGVVLLGVAGMTAVVAVAILLHRRRGTPQDNWGRGRS